VSTSTVKKSVPDSVHVPADELLPSSCSVPAQNVADGLVRQQMPEVGQRSHNPVVSPVGVLARQAQHQILKLRMDAWWSHGPALFRTVEFVSDESAVPGEKGIGFSDMGHFLERFAPQAFANLGQRDSLAIGQGAPSECGSPPRDIRFAEGVLDSPSRSHTPKGAPIGCSSCPASIIEDLMFSTCTISLATRLPQRCSPLRAPSAGQMRRALDGCAPFRPHGDCDGRLRREHRPSPRWPNPKQRPASSWAEEAGLKTNPSNYLGLDRSLHIRR
jgi:hypothetical protein